LFHQIETDPAGGSLVGAGAERHGAFPGSGVPNGSADGDPEPVASRAREVTNHGRRLVGHVASMVAFRFPANHPKATLKLALADVPHPDEFFAKLTTLPGQRRPTSGW